MLARFVPTDVLYLLPDPFRQAFISWTDRARYLERALARAWQAETGREIGDMKFQRVWHGPQGDVPALMLLTTHVETGRRMAVSYFRLPGGPDEPGRLSTLTELMPRADVPLTTAAVLSARFPLVTPAGTLPGVRPRNHYVDGGYFENSGLTTILDVVDVLRRASGKRDTRLVILRIENSRATANVQSAVGTPQRDPDSYFAEIVSPVRALMATRHARGDHARAAVTRVIRDAEAACASQPRNSTAGCVRLEQVVFSLERSCVPIPLGWSLTENARREMRRQLLGSTSDAHCRGEDPTRLNGNLQSIRRVLQILGAREGMPMAGAKIGDDAR